MSNKILLRHLGISDAAVKGTSLTANILMVSVVATIPGFGVQGVLVSAALQMSIAGLLQIPTGLFADHFGASRSVKIGLWLKFLTTASFIIACMSALKGHTYLAWACLAFEAIVDACASSFVDGAYQVAYNNWYQSNCRIQNLEPSQHPFLDSFRYGIWLRLALPLGALGLGGLLHNSDDKNLDFLIFTLLAALLLLRIFTIYRVHRDLLNSTDSLRPKSVNRFSITELLSDDFSTLFIYGFTIFLSVSVSSYLIGQSYYLLQNLGFSRAAGWKIGAALTLFIQSVAILSGRYIYPRLTNLPNSSITIKIYFGILALVSGISVTIISSCGDAAAFMTLVSYCAIMMFFSQAGSRWLLANLLSDVSGNHATRLSVGEVLGLIIFGVISSLVLLSGFPQLGPTVVIATTLAISLVLFFFWRPSPLLSPQWSLRRYLAASLIVAVALFSAYGSVWENRSFVTKTLEIKGQSEQIIVNLFKSFIREAMVQGSVIEVGNRARYLSDVHPDLCVAVEMSDEQLQNCDSWRSHHEHFSQQEDDVYFDDKQTERAGHFSILFDHSEVYSMARNRFFVVLLLFFALGASIFFFVQFVSRRIFSEVQMLTDVASSKSLPSRFLISEFANISEQLADKIKTEIELQNARSVSDFARQIAHDIRSPVTALNVICSQISGLSDNQRKMIESVNARIQDIANSVLSKASKSGIVSLSAFQSEFISLQKSIIEIVAEKRIEHPDCVIHSKLNTVSPSLCIVEANDRELKRIISNLINNAVEAKTSNHDCEISVSLRAVSNFIIISISDNGCGFPAQILNRIGERGVSSVKANGRTGSGLGLFYAKVVVEQWKGHLKILSVAGKGATIEIWLPQKNHPATATSSYI